MSHKDDTTVLKPLPIIMAIGDNAHQCDSMKYSSKNTTSRIKNSSKSKQDHPISSVHNGRAKTKKTSLRFSPYNTPTPLSNLPLYKGKATQNRETTPIRAVYLQEKDTPLKERLDEDPEIRCKYVEEERDAIIQYIGGEVWEGSMEYFTKSVLPPIRPEFNIDQILEYCVQHNALRGSSLTENFSWNHFSLNKSIACETEIYNQSLMDIFDVITNAALETWSGTSPKPEPSCYLYADGNKATWSLKGSDIKPDAHMFLKNPGSNFPKKHGGRHWYTAALSFHFKKSEKDDYENTQQILHSLHHCMAIDPCRRFTLGVTIEGTRTRLWIYSRSMIMTSRSFDFNSDPITLIKVVLSLVFADLVDLGWDPTIDAKSKGEQRSFKIEVAGKHYNTTAKNIISESKANGIYTSATRIYKAFGAHSKSKRRPVIIKDFWPIDDYDTEDILRQMILNDINDPVERKLFKDMTLTPIASGRVKVGKQDDHTETIILRGKSPDSTLTIILPNSKIGSKSKSAKTFEGFKTESDGQTRPLTHRLVRNRRKTYIHRWHYRISFEECAIPYHKLRNLGDMLLVLVCAVKALSVIHKAGWVHRDLSPGNLYLYVDPNTGVKRGIVGDLEYAKKVGSRGRQHVHTCTSDFVALEVLKQEYRYMRDYTGDRNYFASTFNDNLTNAESSTGFIVSKSSREDVWANYLHDLESIWWIAVWTLYTYKELSRAGLTSTEYEQMLQAQAQTGAQLFPGTTDCKERDSFLYKGRAFENCMVDIPSRSLALIIVVILIRESLLSKYEAEGNKGKNPILPDDENTSPSLHEVMLRILDSVPGRHINLSTIDHNSKNKTGGSVHFEDVAHNSRTESQVLARRAELHQELQKTRERIHQSRMKNIHSNSNNEVNMGAPNVKVDKKRFAMRNELIKCENRRITRSMVKQESLQVELNTTN